MSLGKPSSGNEQCACRPVCSSVCLRLLTAIMMVCFSHSSLVLWDWIIPFQHQVMLVWSLLSGCEGEWLSPSHGWVWWGDNSYWNLPSGRWSAGDLCTDLLLLFPVEQALLVENYSCCCRELEGCGQMSERCIPAVISSPRRTQMPT